MKLHGNYNFLTTIDNHNIYKKSRVYSNANMWYLAAKKHITAIRKIFIIIHFCMYIILCMVFCNMYEHIELI